MNYKYWMIHSDHAHASAPSIKHHSYEEAKTEAKRLAQKHPGATFYILEAATAFSTAAPEVKELRVEFAPTAAEL